MIKALQGQLRNLLLLSVSLTLITCSSIIDTDEYDIEGITATSSMVMPLAYGDMSLQDLLSDRDSSFLKVYDDGLLYLLYEEELDHNQLMSDMFELPDQSIPKSVAIPAAPPYPGNSSEETIGTLNTSMNFSFTPEELDQLTFRGGNITATATLSPPNAALRFQVLVEMPDMKLNGAPFSKRLGNGSNPSLSGYDAVLNNNTMPLNLTIIKEPHAGPITIAPGSKVDIMISFTNIEYFFIKGFFGTQTTGLPAETMKVDVFQNTLEGVDASFAEPKASFEVVNEFGMPVRVRFGALEARRANGTQSMAIDISPQNKSSVKINHPTQIRGSASTIVAVSNLNQLLQFKPDEFYYKIDTVMINPPSAGSQPNFAFSDSEFKIKLKVEVPLFGTAKNIVLSDTFDIDLDEVEESEIESAFLKANIVNELPIDATLQLYLANENMVVIDSLIAPDKTKILKGSTVSATGDLVEAGVFNEEIPIVKSKIDKLFDARNIIIKATLNTTKKSDGTSPNVKFKSQYKMNVNFGLKANVKLKADI